GGKCRRARQACVDLDDAVVEATRIERELDVALSDDAEVSNRTERAITQELVLLVVQRLTRSNDDRLARVNAHWIDVFEAAHDDAVVLRVSNDLVFKLLPAAQALFHEHLSIGRKSAVERFARGRLIPYDRGAFAAEGESTPQHDRVTDLARHAEGLLQVRA